MHFTSLPESYIVSGDHMKPDAIHIAKLEQEGLKKLLNQATNC